MKLYSNNLVIMALITTIIINTIGAGLVFPVVPSLFFDNGCVAFSDPGGNFQNWYYSIILSCWPLGLLIGCPIIGELSDKYGRKIILIIALLVTFFSYLLSIYAIYSHNFILFIAGRFINGLAGGVFGIAQAAIIDISKEENRARNIGFVTMAVSLGFVLGPIITSMVSTLKVNHTLPFIFAALVSLVSVLCVTFIIRKDLPKNPGLTIGLNSIYNSISFLISDKRIRFIGIIYLLMQCGWGFYAQGISLFLDDVYSYSIADIGLFYGLMGLAIVIAGITLQPVLFAKYSPTKVFINVIIVLGVGAVLVGVVDAQFMQWLLAVILSIAQLLCYTALLTMISVAVSDKEQGKAMGAAGAGFGLAWLLNSIMMGHLSAITPTMPIIFGGGMFFIALIIFIFAIKVLHDKVK